MLLQTLRDIIAERSVRVVFVYLQEAHATDTWPLTSNGHILSAHRCDEDRISAARAFLDEYPSFASLVRDQWYVDTSDNGFAIQNGLWPERYLLLDGHRVCWASSLLFEERFTDIPHALRDAVATKWL
jgi:hypothetical protein